MDMGDIIALFLSDKHLNTKIMFEMFVIIDNMFRAHFEISDLLIAEIVHFFNFIEYWFLNIWIFAKTGFEIDVD